MNPLDVVSAVLLLAGGTFSLLGGIGLLRFPDVLGRLQAAAKPQTLGILFVLVGAALQVQLSAAGPLVLVGLFQLMTTPVVAQTIGRVAYRRGAVNTRGLTTDELAARLRSRSTE